MIIKGQMATLAARLGACLRVGRIDDTNVAEVTDEVAELMVTAPSIPDIVDRIYPYPRRFESPPFAHQRTTMRVGLPQLLNTGRLFNLSDAGLGKSYATIWMIDVMIKLGFVGKVLILAPKSTLYNPWRKELFEVMPQVQVSLAIGTKAKRAKELARNCPIVIANHHAASTNLAELKAYGFDLVVVDESTIAKTANAVITKNMRELMKEAKYRILLSATPTAHAPLDAHGQLLIAGVPGVSGSKVKFESLLGFAVGAFGWQPFHDARDKVIDLMQPAVRFDKRECLDLPPVIRVYREVGISKEQQQAHDRLIRDAVYEHTSQGTGSIHTVSAVNAMALMTKLLQVSAGIVKGEDAEGNEAIVQLAVQERMDDVISLIENCGEKTLISATYTLTIKMLETKLEKHFGEGSVGVINGEVEPKRRAAIIDEFQNPDSKMRVLVAHPKTVGHGTTLTAASQIIHWTPPMSTEVYLQLNERTNRPGQKAACTTLIHMVGIPLEKERYDVMAAKEDDQQQLLNAYTELMRQHGVTVKIGGKMAVATTETTGQEVSHETCIGHDTSGGSETGTGA